jgi:hypothetical protein
MYFCIIMEELEKVKELLKQLEGLIYQEAEYYLLKAIDSLKGNAIVVSDLKS